MNGPMRRWVAEKGFDWVWKRGEMLKKNGFVMVFVADCAGFDFIFQ